MKQISFIKGIVLIPFLLAMGLSAQTITSFDLGAIRQKNHHNGGVNVSGFYHFTEKFLGGVEVNRFFPVHRLIHDEDELLSGWDIEMNLHYMLPVGKGLKFYPVTGISHTSEKEYNPVTHHSFFQRFWSVNTGAGMQLEWHKWLPHLEYMFTWGHLNQQFVLVGIGYEIEWGKHRKDQAHNEHKNAHAGR